MNYFIFWSHCYVQSIEHIVFKFFEIKKAYSIYIYTHTPLYLSFTIFYQVLSVILQICLIVLQYFGDGLWIVGMVLWFLLRMLRSS